MRAQGLAPSDRVQGVTQELLLSILELHAPQEIEHEWAIVHIEQVPHPASSCPIAWTEDCVIASPAAVVHKATVAHLLSIESGCSFCTRRRVLQDFCEYYRPLLLWDAFSRSDDASLLAAVVLSVRLDDQAFPRWSGPLLQSALSAGRAALPRPAAPPGPVWLVAPQAWPHHRADFASKGLSAGLSSAILWGRRCGDRGVFLVSSDEPRESRMCRLVGPQPATWDDFESRADVALTLARDGSTHVTVDVWESASLLLL
jgi:hypothetical protein